MIPTATSPSWAVSLDVACSDSGPPLIEMLAFVPTNALVASLVMADFMLSVTVTPESSTEIDLDVAVLVELAVKFTLPAVIENVPPK